MNTASEARLDRPAPAVPARPALIPFPIALAPHHAAEPWQHSGYQQPRSCRVMGGSGAVAVLASALILLLWAGRHHDIPIVSAASDAIVVTLAPLPAAPPAPPVEVAPGPARHQQQPDEHKAKPEDSKVPEEPTVQATPPSPLTGPMPAAPAASPPPGTPAADSARVERTTAPPSVPKSAAAAAAPVTSASPSSSALANWQGELLGHLKRFRRYPRQAESAGQEGIAVVSITVDRTGKVLAVKLLHSSGYPLLDMEAQATVRRASPVPAPTAEIAGDPVTAQIPVEFAIPR